MTNIPKPCAASTGLVRPGAAHATTENFFTRKAMTRKPDSDAKRRPFQAGFSQAGFSLPEALLCAAIIAILLRLALPLFTPAPLAEGQRVLLEFDAVLQTARSAAILQGVPVRICPATAAAECGDNWQEGVLALTDVTHNHAAPQLVAYRPWKDLQGSLSWRAFGNRSQLVIDPNGALDYQNGTLLWCPPSSVVNGAAQLIVNSAGRTRLVTDVADARC